MLPFLISVLFHWNKQVNIFMYTLSVTSEQIQGDTHTHVYVWNLYWKIFILIWSHCYNYCIHCYNYCIHCNNNFERTQITLYTYCIIVITALIHFENVSVVRMFHPFQPPCKQAHRFFGQDPLWDDQDIKVSQNTIVSMHACRVWYSVSLAITTVRTIII